MNSNNQVKYKIMHFLKRCLLFERIPTLFMSSKCSKVHKFSSDLTKVKLLLIPDR